MLPRTVMRCLQWLKIKPSVAELSGVNAPVKTERFTKELTVEGTIPLELNGLYIRTGPNIQHAPVGGYHLCAPQKQTPFPADSESTLCLGASAPSFVIMRALEIFLQQERHRLCAGISDS